MMSNCILSSTPTAHPTLCTQCNYRFTPLSQHPPIPNHEICSQQFLLPSETQKLQTWIADEEYDLHRLDQELSRLRVVVEDLESQKTALKYKIRDRQSLLSSSRRLPTEIWSEIFSFCIPDARLSVSKDQWNQAGAVALTLSHVCTRWRNITYEFPALWSSVYVNLYALDRDVIPLLEHYICRSGPNHRNGRGVDVLIRFHKDTMNWKTGTTPLAIRNLHPHLAWTEHSAKTLSFLLSADCMKVLRSLTISEVDVDHFLPSWQPNNTLPLPLLEHFTIDAESRGHPNSPDHDSPSSWRCLWKSIQQAPNLREVVIGSAIGLFSTSFRDMLSHSPVRSLEVRDIQQLEGTITDVVQLLPTLPNLERLRLDGLDFDLSGSTPNLLASVAATESMEYPTIRDLTMWSGYGNNHDTFLNLIRPALSALETLSMAGYRYTMSLRDAESLVSTLATFSSSLRTLFLDYDLAESVGNTLLLDILGALPNLTTLEARLKGRGRECQCILGLLSALANAPSLGSVLGNITVEECNSLLDFETAERIVDLLEARGRERTALREVKLVFGIAWMPEEVTRTDENAERVKRLQQRLTVLEENAGVKCMFYYASWGSRTLVLGPGC
ncbi:hypothetical protein PM082_018307 [Marasmius tenuissimus]|nr:hypothetical protein PM082_018307 [Marasmius tenuissimus]